VKPSDQPNQKKEIIAENRNFGLDLFRAIAILFVVLVHSCQFLNGTVLDGFPFFRMIDGVDLFFVLSGFLIGGILLKEINTHETFGRKQLFNFWKRRWFRTLPAYYLVLIANYFLVKYALSGGDVNQCTWKNFVFLHNFAQPSVDFFWESWSLSVEEWFYLLSPILLIIFLKFTTPKIAFITTTLLMLSFSTIYRICITTNDINHFWFDVTFRKMVVTRLDSIAFGLLAAWLFYYYRSMWGRLKYTGLVAGLAIMVFILNYKSPDTSFYNQVLLFTITPISAALLLPFAQSIQSARGIFAKAITHISKISYSMYLINLGLMIQVLNSNFAPQIALHGILFYISFWIALLVASTLLYMFFEKPMMNLRDKF
jgi:peptidoglycan/LPS O-acetylase OafA/YrhL